MEITLLSDQDELEKIKRRKMRRFLERAEQLQSEEQKLETDQQEQATRVQEARSQILAKILDPEARQYLAYLNDTKPETAQKIESTILPLVLQNRIFYVSKIDIRALERRIEGVEPSILVKRRGEKIKTLSDAMRSDEE